MNSSIPNPFHHLLPPLLPQTISFLTSASDHTDEDIYTLPEIHAMRYLFWLTIFVKAIYLLCYLHDTWLIIKNKKHARKVRELKAELKLLKIEVLRHKLKAELLNVDVLVEEMRKLLVEEEIHRAWVEARFGRRVVWGVEGYMPEG